MDPYYNYYTDSCDGIQVTVTIGFIKAITEEKSYFDWMPGNPLPTFQDCKNKIINISNFYLKTSLKYCPDMSNLNFTDVDNVSGLFFDFDTPEININEYDFSNVKDANGLFAFCDKTISIDMSEQSFSKLEGASGFFSGCSNLKVLDISGIINPEIVEKILMGSDSFALTKLEFLFVANKSIKQVAINSLLQLRTRQMISEDQNHLLTLPYKTRCDFLIGKTKVIVV